MRDFKLRDFKNIGDFIAHYRGEDTIYIGEENYEHLTEEEMQYLEDYFWEAIEENWTYNDGEYKFGPADFMNYLFQDIYRGDSYDRMALSFDLDDQLCDVLQVLVNPKTNHFWGFLGWESKWEETYDYEPFRVEPAEKVVSTWKMGEKVF